ncbi:MAG: hypothetical protein WC091_19455 [Sulfuricellaceae bacterium]
MKKLMIALGAMVLLTAGAAFGASSADATFTSHSDALFDYVERSFSEYFPGHPQDQSAADYNGAGPVFYRTYANGNTLATWWHGGSEDVYYLIDGAGGLTFFGSLADANRLICGGKCWGASSDASDTEVRQYLDTVLGLSNATLSGGVENQLQPILSAAMGQASTCPTVTMNVNLANATDLSALLLNLPKPTLVTVNYGNGCTTASGEKMAGTVELRIDNLTIDPNTQKIALSFGLTSSNLTKNGQVVADGTVAGNFSIGLGGDGAGSGSIQMTNFLVAGGARLSGTVDFNMLSSSSFTVNLALSNSNNVQTRLALSANTASDGSQVISTTTPGTVNQYSVTLNAITYNDKVCSAYPIAGNAVFSTGGNTWTAVFDQRCNGGYTLQ